MPPLVIDYDTNGNRTALTFDAFGESNTYALNSNQLQSMGSSNLTRDAAGNRTSDRNGNRIFTYNNTGRLFEVYEGSSLIATYTYNAMGQRTRKVTNTQTTVYHYDLKGQLIMESNNNGQANTSYLYTETTPVAQIDRTPNGEVITYLHTDHLNTPRRATDSNGITVWAWQGTAFGSFIANEDPDNDGTNTTVNLRFPGQYYDQETQLHYNYFRYYDPQTGRYITSDPIGLQGGMNTYGYVFGNPNRFIDPYGLWGIGFYLQGSIEGGIGYPSFGLSLGTGFGIFSRENRSPQYGFLEGFGSIGAFGTVEPNSGQSCQPDEGLAVGGYAGLSAGVFVTGGNIDDFQGSSAVWNFNLGLGLIQFSASYSFNNGAWIGGLGYGPGWGLSFSRYPTHTYTTQPSY